MAPAEPVVRLVPHPREELANALTHGLGATAALAGSGIPVVDAADMTAAVTEAQAHAQPGDAVLLSPACASLDMYRHYGERADAFRDAARDLALAAGVTLEVLT